MRILQGCQIFLTANVRWYIHLLVNFFVILKVSYYVFVILGILTLPFSHYIKNEVATLKLKSFSCNTS